MISSEYLKIKKHTSKDVIVIFSSVNVPKGKFSATNTFKEIKSNIIFVNTPLNNWFLGEIPGLGKEYREIAQSIDQVVKSLLHTKGKVLYYGGSMGAYGALMFGSLNNADYIVGTGIELNLQKNNGYFFNLTKDRSVLENAPNMKELIKQSESEVILLFGELSFSDLLELKTIKNLSNVQIKGIINCGHKVPIILQNYIGLDVVLYEIMQYGFSDSVKNIEGNLTQHSVVVDFISKKIDRVDIEGIENYIRVNTVDSIVKSYIFFSIAKFYYLNTDFDKALKSLNFCILLNGNHVAGLQLLSKIYKEKNIKELSLIYMERSIHVLNSLKTDSIEYLELLLADLYIFFDEKNKSMTLLNSLENRIQKNTAIHELYLKTFNKV